MKRPILQLAASCFLALTLNSSAAVLYVDLNSINPVSPYTNWVMAATNIQDAVDVATNGDLILATNGIYQTGGWVVTSALTNRVVVDKTVTVQSVNGPMATVIQGYQLPDTTNGDGAVRCVYLMNGAKLIGFTLTSGATRTNLNPAQETYGGGVWCDSQSELVSNCFLLGNAAFNGGGGARNGNLIDCVLAGNVGSQGGGAGGSILNNCIITNNRAGNGGGAIGGLLTNCVLAGNSAWKWGGGAWSSQLNHCLLTNNSATSGGGAYMSTLINCVLSGNVVAPTNYYGGGGAWNCSLFDCLLTSNSAPTGGGAANSGLYNCTVVGNSASDEGGGVFLAGIYNCIVYYNTAPTNPSVALSRGNYSCLNSMPPDFPGYNNLSNAPLFVDPANGNYRLQTNSPCINAGNNAYVSVTNDLDGNLRISGGTVDIGACEFQNPASVISYAWLQQYGLTNNGPADYADTDGDGVNNWQEYLADTSPLDANDYFHITSYARDGTYNTLWWTSKTTRLYSVERCETLDSTSSWETIITNATPGWNNVGFDNTGSRYFYRIRAVQL